MNLFVNHGAKERGVVNKALREPESKLLLGVLNAVGAVNDVPVEMWERTMCGW